MEIIHFLSRAQNFINVFHGCILSVFCLLLLCYSWGRGKIYSTTTQFFPHLHVLLACDFFFFFRRLCWDTIYHSRVLFILFWMQTEILLVLCYWIEDLEGLSIEELIEKIDSFKTILNDKDILIDQYKASQVIILFLWQSYPGHSMSTPPRILLSLPFIQIRRVCLSK